MFEIRPKTGYLLLLAVAASLLACTPKDKKSRPSPPASDSTTIDGVNLAIHYSSPGVKKRKIWGELVPFNEVWRTGANKATVLEISSNIVINGKSLKAGKYAVFTITTDSTWTVIFNEEWDQWGAYSYNDKKDALRLTVTPRKSDYTERMTFAFTDQSLIFEWENLYYELEIDTY